ncbi:MULTISPECIES: hypothetical protein [Kitasatospora]|uniref:hypothetical protein n=1 Tax=Kitasatospora TaxID=2063 RepID=UPI000C711D78|nr:hypothetical protein [Kitasatospora sp. GP30]MDH6140260.1 hypothetical protein [Kitasatospora sp. GP30]
MSVRSHPFTRLLGAAVAVAALALAAPAATAATPAHGDGGGGWHPYRTGGPFDYPAGTVCPFHLYVSVLVDQEESKTAAGYPDGSPKKELFRGPLVLRYANADSGRSVDRDQSGFGILNYLPGGYREWVIPKTSHISAVVHPGDPYHATGDYLFSGGARLLIHPGHQTQVLEQHQVENLCDTLA